MRVSSNAALTAFFFIGLAAGVARADVAPPKGYVEDCTIDKAQARTGTRCKSCQGSAMKEKNECPGTFADTTYAKECSAWGGTFREEVWCDPKEPLTAEEKKASEKKSDKGGCSVTNHGAAGDILGMGLGLMLIGGRRRRRHA